MADDAKIQQFVLLAKGARGRAIVDLIGKATSEPGLFGFGELLAVPSVQEVGVGRSPCFGHVYRSGPHGDLNVPTCMLCAQIKAGEFAPHYNLLQLFAYGTWADYKGGDSTACCLSWCMTVELKR